jgi:hypothetical protein
VQWVASSSLENKFSIANISFYPVALYKYHLTIPAVILGLTSFLVSTLRRDRKILLFVLWILGLYILLLGMGVPKVIRHGMYWIPAFCVLAALVVNLFKNHVIKIIGISILSITILYQFVTSYRMEPEYAVGYEDLAKFVAQNKKGDSVLYGSPNDSGYFIFFLRKYDKNRELIVLRTDKILATSKMDKIVDDNTKSTEQIYQILDNFGVGYLVLDDKTLGSNSLEMLHEEVSSSPVFTIAKDGNIKSNSERFNNTPLSVYEYLEFQPAKVDKIINMDIPLSGDSIKIPFKMLFEKKP